MKKSNITRNNIVKSSLGNFLKNGYNNVSLDLIAKELGISKGAVTYHFSSKLELFEESIKYFLDQINELRVKSIEPIYFKDFLQKFVSGIFQIKNVLFLITGIQDENMNYYRMFLDVKNILGSTNYLNLHFSSSLSEFEQKILNAVKSGEIRRDINIKAFLYELLALSEGFYVIQHFIEIENQEEIANGIFNNIWERIMI
ncbi:MAG: TetR/AcrR family transcriptional regulator [Candidatus Heimdallarchaeota archaeon]|nr:TetR/AcrR family transcriptional regulator [Candidatus Heimdallarchaeota archaeon]